MRIVVVGNVRLPTEKAHGYAIMRTCDAWRHLGHEVSLYVPKRDNEITEDPFQYYAIKPFPLKYIPCFEWIRFARFLGPCAHFLQSYSFVRAFARENVPRSATIFTRDPLAVWYLTRKGYSVIWNMHMWSSSPRFTRYLVSRAKGIVCISQGAQDEVSDLGIPTVIARSGTDQSPYIGAHSEDVRRALGLPEGRTALYAGHLYGWKGAETILEAAKDVSDVQFVIVGGTEKDIARFKTHTHSPNVLVVGYQKKSRISQYLAAADVLLLPNIPGEKISSHYTSPLKLFEYMAAGKPIIASDLPSIREILDESNGYLVEAGNGPALAEKIQYVFAHDHEARNKAQGALIDSALFSWESQAKIAADFMSQFSK